MNNCTDRFNMVIDY